MRGHERKGADARPNWKEPDRRAIAPNRDQRRALRLFAAAPNGATEAIMLAHGFEHALLDDLVLRGRATGRVAT